MKPIHVRIAQAVTVVLGFIAGIQWFDHVVCNERYGEKACVLYSYDLKKLEIVKGLLGK